MSEAPATLAQAIEHEAFPELDLALRRGRHVDRDDAEWYALLSDVQAEFERFYRRFGAELVHRSDGYFFLLPTGDKLGRRHLSPSDMLVGQALALLYLDATTVEHGGSTSRDQVLSTLATAMGPDALLAAFNPGKKRRTDERVAEEAVRARVSESLRRLAQLGFLEADTEERLRLRASLMRFAEPVRGTQGEAEALARLIASGEILLAEDAPGEDEPNAEEDESGQDGEVVEHSPQAREQVLARASAAFASQSEEWAAEFAAETRPTPPPADSAPAEAPAVGEPLAHESAEEAPYRFAGGDEYEGNETEPYLGGGADEPLPYPTEEEDES